MPKIVPDSEKKKILVATRIPKTLYEDLKKIHLARINQTGVVTNIAEIFREALENEVARHTSNSSNLSANSAR